MKKGFINDNVGTFPKCESKSTTKFHPFSYYVDGGLDLTNTETDLSAKIEFDTDEELEFGATAYGCDPRISMFDVAEQFGIQAAEQAKELQTKSKVESKIKADDKTADVSE